jgi:transcriptional regulator with PAS, ATPase and Fis domain
MNDELLLLVARIARLRQLEEQNRTLSRDLGKLEGFEGLIATSPPMREVLDVVRTVAPSDATILIEGESGTGKEVLARAIHRNSPRRDRAFVAISCAALPETLLETELFGHERGAFTDARKDRRGRFELADGGTLFLDDVDDLGLPVQVKLLRALQERVIERVGGEKAVHVDIRVVAATKLDLAAMLAEGKFREDLYYRLNVVPLKLPPLRERTEDVPLLMRHFVERFARGRRYEIKPDVMQALCQYPWPGNVRELENSVERAIAMAGEASELKREHLLLPLFQKNRGGPTPGVTTLKDVVVEAEKDHIRRVLKSTANHKAQAAALLGISRKNLWEKMRDYGIEG